MLVLVVVELVMVVELVALPVGLIGTKAEG